MSSLRVSYRHETNKELPIINKTVEGRSEQRNYQLHVQRLRKIKPMIDNKPSPTSGLSHMQSNAKRDQMMNERNYAIECENALLLDKMRRIMHLGTVGSNSGASPYYEEIEPKSLNAGKRRRELQRITAENMGIVRRIQGSASNYEVDRWYKERKETEQMLSRISKFRARSDMSASTSNMSELSTGSQRPYRLAPLVYPPPVTTGTTNQPGSMPPMLAAFSAPPGGFSRMQKQQQQNTPQLHRAPPPYVSLDLLGLKEATDDWSEGPWLQIEFRVGA